MLEAWIELSQEGSSLRVPLRRGVTRIGGEGADVPLPAAGREQLQVWDDPPKLVFVGRGEPPRVNGRPVEEQSLATGDVIEWAGARLRFQRGGEARLEELPRAAAPAAGRAGVAPQADPRVWRRLKAGLLVELGLADRGAARRWQEAVVADAFQPDACADDLLERDAVPDSDPRLLERSARLQRDLVMAPAVSGVRGAGRKVRGAARSGLAFLVAQLVIVLCFGVLALVALFVVRLRWGVSVDGFLDALRAGLGL